MEAVGSLGVKLFRKEGSAVGLNKAYMNQKIGYKLSAIVEIHKEMY